MIFGSGPIRVGSKPSAQDVLPLASRTGYLGKKSNSFLSYFFPWWFPPYKIRFVVIAGGYIYKFKSENAEKPKGIPIPLDCSDIHKSSIDDVSFEIYTLRKRYIFRGQSEEDCKDWISSINARKAASIKEKMGHSQVSSDLSALNKTADRMFHTKLDYEGVDRSSVMNPMMYTS